VRGPPGPSRPTSVACLFSSCRELNPEKTCCWSTLVLLVSRVSTRCPSCAAPKVSRPAPSTALLNMLRKLAADYKAGARAWCSTPRQDFSATTCTPSTRQTARPCPTTCRAGRAAGEAWRRSAGRCSSSTASRRTTSSPPRRPGEARRLAHRHLDRRQGLRTARRRARDARQHDVQREAGHRGVKKEVRRPAGEIPRLPDADRGRDRQHPRRRQGRAETACKWIEKYARSGVLEHAMRSPASPARTCARWPTGCRRRASCSPSSATSSCRSACTPSPTASPISESSASSTGASSSRAG